MNKINVGASIPKGENNGTIPVNFSLEKAYEAQIRLSKKIILEDHLPKRIRTVAGVDVAYVGDIATSAVAVVDYETLEPIEMQTAVCNTKFPYIPNLFAFKELPPALACFHKLSSKPDIFLIDGHGIAHPRRCGFASHFGVVMEKPTIGVAKNILVGNLESANGKVYIVHNDERVGEAIRTKEGCRTIYVSVGNMISLERAVSIVKHLARNNRIPEPLRIAHKLASQQKSKWASRTRIEASY